MPQVNTDDITVPDVIVVLNDIVEKHKEETVSSLFYDIMIGLKPKTRDLLKEQMDGF